MAVFSTRKKRMTALIAGSAIIAIAAVSGVAYAYWTSSGTGSGSATTGTSAGFTVTSQDPTGGPLTPGGGGETVGFTITNPGPGVLKLSSVVITVANDDGSTWTPTGDAAGCSTLDYAIAAPTVTYGNILALGNRTGTVVVTMNNLGTNQDACKNVAVPLYIVAS
jgi:hypothetical protein